MSPILVALTSHTDSNFERSNSSFKENIPDGIDPASDGFYYCVRKKEGRTLRLSADCITRAVQIFSLAGLELSSQHPYKV